MSDSKTAREQPIDLATIAADDLLLDALGQGGKAACHAAGGEVPGAELPAADPVAAMLAAWHAELSAGAPDGRSDADLIRLAAAPDPEPVPAPAPLRPPYRVGRRLVRAAAAVVVAGLAVGVAIGSNHAGPSSPLWPLTKVMYPEQAETRAAEHVIARARAAAQAGRFEEARRLLDEARRHVDRITDPAVADRLRADLDDALRDVPAAAPAPTAAPSPVRTPGDGADGNAPTPTRAPDTNRRSPAPEQPAPGGRVVPERAPALPLPSLPAAPDPTPVTSELPDLPLLPGGLLG